MTDPLEKVAKAIYETQFGDGADHWVGVGERNREWALAQARAAILALAANVTDEMADAATRSLFGNAPDSIAAWRDRNRTALAASIKNAAGE